MHEKIIWFKARTYCDDCVRYELSFHGKCCYCATRVSSKQYYITHPIIIRFFLSSNAVAITQVTISNNLIHFIDFCVFQTSYGSYLVPKSCKLTISVCALRKVLFKVTNCVLAYLLLFCWSFNRNESCMNKCKVSHLWSDTVWCLSVNRSRCCPWVPEFPRDACKFKVGLLPCTISLFSLLKHKK